MSAITILTWNMQGGNEDKWLDIVKQDARIKCLQECSRPKDHFTEVGSGKLFNDTDKRVVDLVVVSQVAYVTRGDNFYRNQCLQILKFAPFGPQKKAALRKAIDKENAAYKEMKYKNSEEYKSKSKLDMEIEDYKKEKDHKKKINRLEEKRAEADFPDDSRGYYRSSRCNLGALFNNGYSITAQRVPLDPLLKVHRPIQIIQVEYKLYQNTITKKFMGEIKRQHDFELSPPWIYISTNSFLVFNIHAVANQKTSYDYFRHFHDLFDTHANICAASGWVCVGDFNLDARTMEDALKMEDEIYKDKRAKRNRDVVYSKDQFTHFSYQGEDVDDDEEEDTDDNEDDSGEKEKKRKYREEFVSLQLKYNTMDKDKYSGRYLDYAIFSKKCGSSVKCNALEGGFLSDHRPVEFTFDPAIFDAGSDGLYKPKEKSMYDDYSKKRNTKKMKRNEDEDDDGGGNKKNSMQIEFLKGKNLPMKKS